ncbi:TPA: aminopeptidase P family protein [Candidatus Bathyarchaeota archaeon]|nr:aminopeptidase P family protein [Candidatus Bathyarchaeota archaeon]
MELYDKIVAAVKGSTFDVVLVTGADNFTYMAGAAVPFLALYHDSPVAVVWPKRGDPTIIAPEEWAETIVTLSSVKKTATYSGGVDTFAKAVADALKAKKEARIGVDLLRIPEATLQQLKKLLSGTTWASCDGLIRELRAVKTEEELEALEDVAYRVDHGIFGTQHHVLITSTRSEMSLAEETRVHCLERGLDVIGGQSISQGASGPNASKFWPRAPYYGIGHEKKLKEGEYVRIEARYSIDGYWGTGSRLMTQGYPTAEQREAYNGLVAMREAALAAMKPGAKCSDVYKAMKATAKERGAKLVEGLALGHGIGVADVEAPYLSAKDDTKICPGLALVIRPVVEGPKGELLWSSDTVLVEEDGPRVVGWYKDWRAPYTANYTL